MLLIRSFGRCFIGNISCVIETILSFFRLFFNFDDILIYLKYRIFYTIMEGKNRQEGRGRKMRSVFEEIYSGKKFTGNSVPVRGRERENARRERAAEEAFRATLSEDQRKRFAEYLETVAAVREEEFRSGYLEGVKIGILMGVEAAGVLPEE